MPTQTMPNRQSLHETVPEPPKHFSQYVYIVFGTKSFKDHYGPSSRIMKAKPSQISIICNMISNVEASRAPSLWRGKRAARHSILDSTHSLKYCCCSVSSNCIINASLIMQQRVPDSYVLPHNDLRHRACSHTSDGRNIIAIS